MAKNYSCGTEMGLEGIWRVHLAHTSAPKDRDQLSLDCPILKVIPNMFLRTSRSSARKICLKSSARVLRTLLC